jgi:hypothetical protein
VLTRDPSGRSLLWGNRRTDGHRRLLPGGRRLPRALGPGPLVATRGTAITLLADAGPLVSVLGSIYVVLAIGLGSIYVTSACTTVIELVRRRTSTLQHHRRLGAERRHG